MIIKPPLGVMPKYIWDYQRIEDLKDAINRYCEARLIVPLRWVEEYNELINIYKNK